MDNWWQLGNGIGYRGGEIQLYQITCPFCLEKGNFKLDHRAEKKKPNADKRLYFDTYECGNCKGYVMVLWSKSEYGGSGIWDYRVLPWPLSYDSSPAEWPQNVGRFWLQAKRNVSDGNWDAAAVMARSAMQLALREQGAVGKTLKQEIDDLASKGVLPPLMNEWSHELRELGNESAHPDPAGQETNAQDAYDVVEFLDYLLQYLYSLPHRIRQYRGRTKDEPV